MKDWFIKNIAYFLIGFVTIAVAAYIYLISNNQGTMLVFGDATQLLIALFAGISIPFLFGQKEFRDRIQTQPWMFIGAGFLAWAVGQAYWAFEEIVKGVDMAAKSFSFADIGFLLLYPLVITGFIIQRRRLGKIKMPPWWLVVSLVVFSGAMVYLTWGTLVESYGSGDTLWFVSQLLYLLGDITIVIGCALVAWRTRGGIVSTAWTILLASFTVFAFGNQFYNYYNTLLGNNYKTGNLIDLTWILAFIIAWVGANVFHTMLKDHN